MAKKGADFLVGLGIVQMLGLDFIVSVGNVFKAVIEWGKSLFM